MSGSRDSTAPDSLTLFMGHLSRYPLLTAAQEVELATQIERGDREAKERMLNSNLRLVVFIARHYLGKGLPLDDLVQEGVLGLTRAIEKFDYRKGCKFSTYASWWIRQACQRAVANQSRTIRLPVHVADRRRKLVRAREEHVRRYQREPTLDELARATATSKRHSLEALRAAEVATSLNKPVGESGTELGELIPEPKRDSEEEVADPRAVAVRQAVLELPEPQRSVLSLRFGFRDGARTQEEVAQVLNTSPRRVRNLEREALAALQKALALEASSFGTANDDPTSTSRLVEGDTVATLGGEKFE
jgi:RNA polymerase primary sigma factor